MLTAALVGLLTGTMGFGGGYSPGAQVHVPDTIPASAVDVPFLPQGPLLCGGAAAAMVERFWGARGVYGEDYKDLVRTEEGGIRTSELTAAMEERGYTATSSTYDTDRVFAALEAGVPPILLLESGVTRLHYVVLVALEGEHAWIHDPNFGPDRRMGLEQLLEQWSASGFWALLVTPSGADAASRAPGAEPAPGSAPMTAPATGAPAAARDPAILAAMERLRDGDFPGARGTVHPLLERANDDSALARRVLATAWFLEGEAGLALDAWNELGEPPIDLVRIVGTDATRHHVAADRISLRHGELLTEASLALARRRLSLLPAVQASRVEYRPLPDGSVEVEAVVLERPRVPGYPTLAAEGFRALVNGRAALGVGPLMAAGDRWRLGGGWVPAQRYVGGSVSTPAPPLPGIATVGVEWRRERFAVEGPGPDVTTDTEKRYRGWLELEEWIHPSVRLGASLALESWEVPGWNLSPEDGSARLVAGGLATRWTTDDDRSWLEARGDAWAGSGRSFGRTRLEGGTTLPHGVRREWRLRAGGVTASRDAPRTLWPGAGTGRIRTPLLRAHGLVVDGAIQGPAFGRQLVHGTVEHRIFRRAGPFRAGAALFVDLAHASARAGTLEDRGFVDVGGGLFFQAGSQEAAVSLARGSSGWRLSAQLEARP